MKPPPGRDCCRCTVTGVMSSCDTNRFYAPSGGYWTKSSPSRFPFRPPLPLTFPFRVQPSSSASTYSGPVLGARRNLGRPPGPCKGLETRRGRNLRKFNYPHVHSRPCSVWISRTARLPLSRTVNVGGRAPAHAIPLSRHDLVFVGPVLRPLDLVGHGRDRDHRRDVVHHRSPRGPRGFHSRSGVRRRRAGSERAARARPLTRAQREHEPPRKVGADQVAQAIEDRLARLRVRLGAVREKVADGTAMAAVERGTHYSGYRRPGPARFIPPRREGTKRSCVRLTCGPAGGRRAR
jgi:hypothetical protein